MAAPDLADLMRVTAAPASDGWGFVGVVLIGATEVYRTLQVSANPQEAQRRTSDLVGEVLGSLLAGREWQQMKDQAGHPPLREDLGFGLRPRRRHDRED